MYAVLDFVESLNELGVRARDCIGRVHAAFPRYVANCEQEITEFLFDRIGSSAMEFRSEFVEFFSGFLECGFCGRPVKPDLCG